MAAGKLGCHCATFSPAALDELAKLPFDGTKQPGQAVSKASHVKMANTDIDSLADGGGKLDGAISADPIDTARLEDALRPLTEAEERSKAKIEEAMELA
ncbi:Transaldolase [Tolypocladium paradoxum]|uniref:Transaldolase n=1 Tax=Tolypocladium paradoxum TaxID=94208 RepID=A0A2S4KLQ0_9HYPO|nr:Transaldolase [Tolypocladium paradoxum]